MCQICPLLEQPHVACLLPLLLCLDIIILNLHNVTYGWKDLAFDALPAVDIFSGLQVAGNTPLSTEAAQHPCVSGAG